jgi:hypothetical protein
MIERKKERKKERKRERERGPPMHYLRHKSYDNAFKAASINESMVMIRFLRCPLGETIDRFDTERAAGLPPHREYVAGYYMNFGTSKVVVVL